MGLSTSHLEIAVESISCFRDDGTLDLKEVKHLIGMALRDQVIDDEEKRVLGNIFSKVTRGEVTQETWDAMQEARSKYGI